MITLAALLLIIHFVAPLGYYLYLRNFYRRSDLVKDKTHRPSVTVVIPTYNESNLVTRRLDNVASQDYPRESFNILLVDSGSTDDTVEIAKQWIAGRGAANLRIVEEPYRKGKSQALNYAVGLIYTDIVVFTDADCSWEPHALSKAMAYFSDSRVGAITGIKEPLSSSAHTFDQAYRDIYNKVRILESNRSSTPIFNGEFAGFRRELLQEAGLFPATVGADDSYMATFLALKGFRSVAVPDVRIFELIPSTYSDFMSWRVRRAKHLIQHFAKSIRMVQEAPGGFRLVLISEAFLHLPNPWLLFGGAALLLAGTVFDPRSFYFPIFLVTTVGLLLIPKMTRQPLVVWVVSQAILCYAALTGIKSKELIWQKPRKFVSGETSQPKSVNDHTSASKEPQDSNRRGAS